MTHLIYMILYGLLSHASQSPEKGTNETRTLYQQFHPQKAGQQRKTRAGPTLARYHKYHAILTVYTLW